MQYRARWERVVDAASIEEAAEEARDTLDEASFTVEPVAECKGKAAARTLHRLLKRAERCENKLYLCSELRAEIREVLKPFAGKF